MVSATLKMILTVFGEHNCNTYLQVIIRMKIILHHFIQWTCDKSACNDVSNTHFGLEFPFFI